MGRPIKNKKMQESLQRDLQKQPQVECDKSFYNFAEKLTTQIATHRLLKDVMIRFIAYIVIKDLTTKVADNKSSVAGGKAVNYGNKKTLLQFIRNNFNQRGD